MVAVSFRLTALTVATVVALGIACGDSDPAPVQPPPPPPYAGSYALTEINQQSLPFPWIEFGGGFEEVVEGSLEFQAAGKFTMTLVRRRVENGVEVSRPRTVHAGNYAEVNGQDEHTFRFTGTTALAEGSLNGTTVLAASAGGTFYKFVR